MENENRDDDIIDLGALLWSFLTLLGRFWWIIPIFLLAAVAAGCIRLERGYVPMYRSEASFTVVTADSENDGLSYYYDNATASQLADTFPYLMSSSLLTDSIKRELGVERLNGSLSASVIPDSNLVSMSVTSTSAADAKAILEAAIRVYPEVSRFVIGATRFYIIEPPTEPSEPYNQPSYKRTAAKWGLAGAGAALLLLAAGAWLRKTVQTTDELKRDMSLSCLISVPRVRFKARGSGQSGTLSSPGGKVPESFSESMRGLWLRVSRELKKNGGMVLLITSTVPEEGKTTIAVNLARVAASHGMRTLLIDGNLRKAGDGTEAGLAEAITGEADWDAVIHKEEESGILRIGSGRIKGRIAALLSGAELGEFMDTARERMDLIILDTPPCGPYGDAAALAEQADGIVYVVRYDTARKRRILEGISMMEDTGARLIGYVFNAVPVHGSGYGYYGYGRYGYGYYGYGHYGRYGYGRRGYGTGFGSGGAKDPVSEEMEGTEWEREESPDYEELSERDIAAAREEYERWEPEERKPEEDTPAADSPEAAGENEAADREEAKERDGV